MFCQFVLCAFFLCQLPRFCNCRQDSSVVGDNVAILKKLRRSLTVGWRAELIDIPETKASEQTLKSRGKEKETLGEKQMRLVQWHLDKGPLKQFNKWHSLDRPR